MKKIIAATFFLLASACLLGGTGESGAQETTEHRVVRGDTLWDLSGNYLADPLLWPKIWKVNPGIANPHWIYPGQTVRIPGGTGRPGATAGEGAGTALLRQLVTVDLEKAPPPLRIMTRDRPAADDRDDAAVFLERAYDRGIGSVTFEIPRDGVVGNTESGWNAAGHLERIAISAPNARVGQLFGVYRDLGKVSHPDKLNSPGHLLADIAIIEIVEADAVNQYGKVVRAFAEVREGDVLGAVPAVPVVAAARHGAKAVSGTVVAMHMGRQLAGSDDIVYLDLGARDGLAPGDLLFVQDADRTNGDREAAQAMVLRTTATTAAAVLTMRSSHEVVPGDRVGPRR